MQRLRDPNLFT